MLIVENGRWITYCLWHRIGGWLRGKLSRQVNEFGGVCRRRKLRVNVSMSKIMRCRRRIGGGMMNIMMDWKILREVVKVYCGCKLRWKDVKLGEKLKSMLNMVGKVLGGIKRVFSCRSLRTTIVHIHNQLTVEQTIWTICLGMSNKVGHDFIPHFLNSIDENIYSTPTSVFMINTHTHICSDFVPVQTCKCILTHPFVKYAVCWSANHHVTAVKSIG